jgi:hypothetical protein
MNMSRDIFGEYTVTNDGIAQNLIQENTKFYSLSHKMGTKQGFYLMDGLEQISGVLKTGFYAIFKNKKCVYVGHSMNETQGLSNRIARFVKGVLGKCTFHENHSAATKYRFFYGEDFSNLEIVIMPYTKIPKGDALGIENSVIRILKPQFNS